MIRIMARWTKASEDVVVSGMASVAGEREGRVLELTGRTGKRVTELSHVSRSIAEFGAAAGIVVDAESGKTASAHDLRRAFGHRWSRRVMPATLKELMRHASVETTMKYYVGDSAAQTASEL